MGRVTVILTDAIEEQLRNKFHKKGDLSTYVNVAIGQRLLRDSERESEEK